MPSRVTPNPDLDDSCASQGVCIHTRKIYDSCRAKDCLEDLRVYVTQSTLQNAQSAVSVRARDARLIWVSSDVEELTFNRGYYTIDLRFYYRICLEVCSQTQDPAQVDGLAIFSKRVILFGSEGSVKVFSSDSDGSGADLGCQPIAVVEAVDPIVLRARFLRSCGGAEGSICGIPEIVNEAFDSPIVFDDDVRLAVSLGQFSIVRLERDTQLNIPCFDYCIPTENCECGEEEDPCTLFSRINFPTDEFFPPSCISDGGCCREGCETQ